MKHLALVMGILFLFVLAFNDYCSSEEPAKNVTEQAVEEGKAEVKEATEAQEQTKETVETEEEKTEEAAEAAKQETK